MSDPKPAATRATDDRGEPASLGEFRGHEIYPMPMFATLAVDDVVAVADWYARALGFGTVFAGPAVGGQPSLVHLRRKKYQDLLLVPSRGAGAAGAPPSLTLSFQTDDVDELARQARSAGSFGASAIDGPTDTPWNTRDLRVTDPAGHRLVFTGQQTNPDPERMARMQKMFDAARKSTPP